MLKAEADVSFSSTCVVPGWDSFIPPYRRALEIYEEMLLIVMMLFLDKIFQMMQRGKKIQFPISSNEIVQVSSILFSLINYMYLIITQTQGILPEIFRSCCQYNFVGWK